jgi:hypothetical protein
MQHLDGSGAWPSYIEDARFLKVKLHKFQIVRGYKVPYCGQCSEQSAIMYQHDGRAVIWCHLTWGTDITERHDAVGKTQICTTFYNFVGRHVAI